MMCHIQDFNIVRIDDDFTVNVVEDIDIKDDLLEEHHCFYEKKVFIKDVIENEFANSQKKFHSCPLPFEPTLPKNIADFDKKNFSEGSLRLICPVCFTEVLSSDLLAIRQDKNCNSVSYDHDYSNEEVMINDQHNDLTCIYCGYNCQNPEEMLVHKINQHYRCHICQRCFTSMNALQIHESQAHNKQSITLAHGINKNNEIFLSKLVNESDGHVVTRTDVNKVKPVAPLHIKEEVISNYTTNSGLTPRDQTPNIAENQFGNNAYCTSPICLELPKTIEERLLHVINNYNDVPNFEPKPSTNIPKNHIPIQVKEESFVRITNKDFRARHLPNIVKTEPSNIFQNANDESEEVSHECHICLEVFSAAEELLLHLACVHKKDVEEFTDTYSTIPKMYIFLKREEVAEELSPVTPMMHLPMIFKPEEPAEPLTRHLPIIDIKKEVADSANNLNRSEENIPSLTQVCLGSCASENRPIEPNIAHTNDQAANRFDGLSELAQLHIPMQIKNEFVILDDKDDENVRVEEMAEKDAFNNKQIIIHSNLLVSCSKPRSEKNYQYSNSKDKRLKYHDKQASPFIATQKTKDISCLIRNNLLKKSSKSQDQYLNNDTFLKNGTYKLDTSDSPVNKNIRNQILDKKIRVTKAKRRSRRKTLNRYSACENIKK